MKNAEADAGRVWKQIEDVLVPGLGLSAVDRAVYAHLLRHSRLEGKPRLHFSIGWLARGAGLSPGCTRSAMRRLLEQGILRLLKRSHTGQTVEVRLPDEIRLDLVPELEGRKHARGKGAEDAEATTEEIDFLANPAVRKAIHARERGFCFYCLRGVDAEEEKTLDHVVPRVEGGGNSYRNLVSCCPDCNSYKGGKRADDFLRRLYREGWLTGVELTGRMRALEDLVAGKLRPALEGSASGSDEPEGMSAGEDKADNRVGSGRGEVA